MALLVGDSIKFTVSWYLSWFLSVMYGGRLGERRSRGGRSRLWNATRRAMARGRARRQRRGVSLRTERLHLKAKRRYDD